MRIIIIHIGMPAIHRPSAIHTSHNRSQTFPLSRGPRSVWHAEMRARVPTIDYRAANGRNGTPHIPKLDGRKRISVSKTFLKRDSRAFAHGW